MKHRNVTAFILALIITAAIGWGGVYFINVLWPVLPGWVAVIIFIILAASVIGYPIYALGKWSDRYMAKCKTENRAEDDEHRTP